MRPLTTVESLTRELLSIYLNTDTPDPAAQARKHAEELIALGWTKDK